MKKSNISIKLILIISSCLLIKYALADQIEHCPKEEGHEFTSVQFDYLGDYNQDQEITCEYNNGPNIYYEYKYSEDQQANMTGGNWISADSMYQCSSPDRKGCTWTVSRPY